MISGGLAEAHPYPMTNSPRERKVPSVPQSSTACSTLVNGNLFSAMVSSILPQHCGFKCHTKYQRSRRAKSRKSRRNMENRSNTWLLFTAIGLAWLPTAILLLRHFLLLGHEGWAFPIALLVALIWLRVAIGYYQNARKKSALWIFALLPVVFGVIVLELLITIGVVLSRGRW